MSAVNCERYIVRNATALSAFMALLALAVSASRCLAHHGSPLPSGSILASHSDDLPSDFNFSTVLGQQIRRADLRGHLVLIAFLQIIPDTAENFSRVQLQYLRSMNTQYRGMGLVVLLVDESYLTTRVPSQPDDLLNAVYDLNLNGLALIPDSLGEIRSVFHVKKVPTTLLFDAAGHPVERWNRLVLPAFLAESIQRISETSSKDADHVYDPH